MIRNKLFHLFVDRTYSSVQLNMKVSKMKTSIAAVILVASTVSAFPCGFIANFINPDCKPPAELLVQDTNTCKSMKMPLQNCLAYLQNQRIARMQMQATIAASIPDHPMPVYQPPTIINTWRPTCANANLIGC